MQPLHVLPLDAPLLLFPRALEVPKRSASGSAVKVSVAAKMSQGVFDFPVFNVDFDLSYENGGIRLAGVARDVKVPCVAGDIVANSTMSSLQVTNLAGSGFDLNRTNAANVRFACDPPAAVGVTSILPIILYYPVCVAI